jgi:hypothetical protein
VERSAEEMILLSWNGGIMAESFLAESFFWRGEIDWGGEK